MNRLNLNADLGESFGAWKMGSDTELLQIVGSANIACGFHAGDPLVMRRTVRQALTQALAAPTYEDSRLSAWDFDASQQCARAPSS